MKRNIMLTMLAAGCLVSASAQRFEYTYQNNKLVYEVTSENTCSMVTTDPDRGDFGDLVIPATVEYDGHAYEVNRIESFSFWGVDCTSVVMPNTITSVAFCPFYDIRECRSVTFPDVEPQFEGELGHLPDAEAFYGSWITDPHMVVHNGEIVGLALKGVEELTFPEDATILSTEIWSRTLKSLTVPDGWNYDIRIIDAPNVRFKGSRASADGRMLISEYGRVLCANLNGLTAYTIPEGVTEIPDNIFYAGSVKSMTFPETIEMVDWGNPFSDENKLSNLREMHGPLASDDGRCLVNKEGYLLLVLLYGTDYTLPANVKCINTRHVYGENLRTLTIPETCERIEDLGAIDRGRLPNLTNVYGKFSNAEGTMVVYEDILFYLNLDGANHYTVPDGLKVVDGTGMHGIDNLGSVTVPQSVHTVFEFSQLPINSLQFKHTRPYQISPYWGANNEHCVLYVPEGCRDAFAADEHWGTFVDIREGVMGYRLCGQDVRIREGKPIVLNLELENEDELTAIQLDIKTPTGFTIAQDDDGDYLVRGTSRLTSSHTTTVSPVEGGYRLACYSTSNKAIKGRQGAIFTITLQNDGSMAEGNDYEVKFSKMIATKSGSLEQVEGSDNIVTLRYPAPLAGDANDNGRVSITDVTHIVSYIMEQPEDCFRFKSADVNGDGKITVADITLTLDIILGR